MLLLFFISLLSCMALWTSIWYDLRQCGNEPGKQDRQSGNLQQHLLKVYLDTTSATMLDPFMDMEHNKLKMQFTSVYTFLYVQPAVVPNFKNKHSFYNVIHIY